MIEGSGYVPLNNGSGCGRPKKITDPKPEYLSCFGSKPLFTVILSFRTLNRSSNIFEETGDPRRLWKLATNACPRVTS